MSRLVPYFIIVIVSLYIQIVPSGPDAKLYFGLGETLLNGLEYIDNIRNDEILPSIGYPFIIMLALKLGVSGKAFITILLMSSFLLLFEGFKNLKINILFPLVLSLILVYILPAFHIWGMEIMLIFSTMLLFYSSTLLINNKNMFTVLFFTCILLLNVLIRPILMPLIYLTIPFVIYYTFKYSNFKKNMLIALSIFIITLLSIGAYSYHKHDDKRYLSGTYSEIPLYCAWNKYISLESIYYSSRWKSINKDILKEAVAPLQNNNGWENRASLLKSKVIEFVFEEPEKAFNGYIWRLSKFTYFSDIKPYTYLIYMWLFLFLINLFYIKRQSIENKLLFLFISLLPLYVIAITSVFIYAGSRYLVTPSLYIILSIGYLLYLLKHKSKK